MSNEVEVLEWLIDFIPHSTEHLNPDGINDSSCSQKGSQEAIKFTMTDYSIKATSIARMVLPWLLAPSHQQITLDSKVIVVDMERIQ